MGRTDRGSPRGRPRLVSSWRQALAWSFTDHGNDAHRADWNARRPERTVDGKSHRRAIRKMSKDLKMKIAAAAFALTSLGSWAAQSDDVRSVAPALDSYTQDRLLGEVW